MPWYIGLTSQSPTGEQSQMNPVQNNTNNITTFVINFLEWEKEYLYFGTDDGHEYVPTCRTVYSLDGKTLIEYQSNLQCNLTKDSNDNKTIATLTIPVGTEDNQLNISNGTWPGRYGPEGFVINTNETTIIIEVQLKLKDLPNSKIHHANRGCISAYFTDDNKDEDNKQYYLGFNPLTTDSYSSSTFAKQLEDTCLEAIDPSYNQEYNVIAGQLKQKYIYRGVVTKATTRFQRQQCNEYLNKIANGNRKIIR
eukprot:UN03902